MFRLVTLMSASSVHFQCALLTSCRPCGYPSSQSLGHPRPCLQSAVASSLDQL
ncbi:hypothetical protein PF005_g32135 [Phytophthora fragariae]|uniref:Uncharacterized protein n=2 Tax=Phytophthora TaxID=4783 RepID=A0A6A3DD76_9STRA|nr:hypothetical protein PF003_g10025 [Phytophthora fragariae]KAE9001662.1 hypothetical protein PR002_g17855 [Phytophthora rubi]KAE8906361.1 hypothetical protein PF003_g10031 [Phytophthora fragariae]KAE8906364.1 hypothetical protein PF003_g10036 [Phytophthora fragariae]KAE8917537.1 hypothetical protein PF009_g32141 [Phytophthora fragariae]